MSGNQATIARIRRLYGAELRDDEKFIPSYAQDVAVCDCQGTHLLASVPCVPIGRSERGDRCLVCDTTWRRRMGSWDPAEVLERGAPQPAGEIT